GTWLVTTRTRWRDNDEWLELWLLDPNGTASQRLTDDGQCRNGAIRPAVEPSVDGAGPSAGSGAPLVDGAGPSADSGELGLTFAWAQALRSAADRPAAGEAVS